FGRCGGVRWREVLLVVVLLLLCSWPEKLRYNLFPTAIQWHLKTATQRCDRKQYLARRFTKHLELGFPGLPQEENVMAVYQHEPPTKERTKQEWRPRCRPPFLQTFNVSSCLPTPGTQSRSRSHVSTPRG
ncbi:unnamed protein product, partial [Ectocarpus sp. 13 AM-2016]